ncbi:MAG: NADH-quinone oxidoreductase subunit C [Longimicrobiales bacterium]|nr:NADH-quinone oxidoreductase subunit C [Longimicrobiales bacterium]
MTDDTPFDAVAAGPRPSDAHDPELGGHPAEVPDHPSVTALRATFGDAIRAHQLHAGDENVVFVDPAALYAVLEFLQQDPDQRYDYLLDLTAVDYGAGTPIQVVYQLWSLGFHRMLRVKVELPLDALEVDSVEPLWKTADWLEREVWDLFGVTFRGHPDLRRILMPANYAEGHPLRKDFPLRGRFSRAEQTRRALALEVDDNYTVLERELGAEPQIVPAAPAGEPDDGRGSDDTMKGE